MQWQGLFEFTMVAQTHSFTEAAKRLELSTAQVSRQVTALEKRLAVKLFYRTTRKVTLTEEGRVFYQHCQAIIEGLSEAENAVMNLRSTPKGHIRLTAPVTYGEQVILPLVSGFCQQFDEVTVKAELTNQQVDLVEQGFDLAIRIGKIGRFQPDGQKAD